MQKLGYAQFAETKPLTVQEKNEKLNYLVFHDCFTNKLVPSEYWFLIHY